MGLKLWKHNHGCQIAEDTKPLFCIAFVALHKEVRFFSTLEDKRL
jgi:hypothetical protein